MTATEFLNATYIGHRHIVRPRVTCADGFSISIQGGTSTHYCSPRETCNVYHEVELAFPSEIVPDLLWFAEMYGQPTDSIYGYVPIELVEEVISNHGGICGYTQGHKEHSKESKK